MPEKFNPGLRDRVVRMVYDRQAREGGTRAASIRAVAPQLGVGTETLRIWCDRYVPTEPAALHRSVRRSTRLLQKLRLSYRIVAGRVVRLGRSRWCGRGESCQRLLPTPTAHGLAVGTEPECLCWLVLAAASTPPGWTC